MKTLRLDLNIEFENLPAHALATSEITDNSGEVNTVVLPEFPRRVLCR